MLLLITGLPGAGKTTLARALAARTGALQLNSDVLRRELGLRGHYRPEDKNQVYERLLARARAALLAGQNVVVDSTFFLESIREPFRRLATACRVPLYWVEVQAQEHHIRERLQHPRPDSEADAAVFEKIKMAYEPLPEPHLVLHTDELPLDALVEAVQEYLQAQSEENKLHDA